MTVTPAEEEAEKEITQKTEVPEQPVTPEETQRISRRCAECFPMTRQRERGANKRYPTNRRPVLQFLYTGFFGHSIRGQRRFRRRSVILFVLLTIYEIY